MNKYIEVSVSLKVSIAVTKNSRTFSLIAETRSLIPVIFNDFVLLALSN